MVTALLAFLGTAVPCLYLLFRFRGTDFVYLLVLTLLVTWLNRFNWFYSLEESPFFFLWGVLAGLSFFLIWIPNRRTQRLLATPTRRIAAAVVVLLCILTVSNIAMAVTDA
jgi:peptidoglycan/LPS O-acetylase OafA/YrhL